MEMPLSKQGKMNKHILICGEKCVGKSTLIQRLLDEACLTVGGFCTKTDENTGEVMHPIYIYPAAVISAARRRFFQRYLTLWARRICGIPVPVR